MNNYAEKVDKIVMRDVSKLKNEFISLLCVLVDTLTDLNLLISVILFSLLLTYYMGIYSVNIIFDKSLF